jgi:hypothetical protein
MGSMLFSAPIIASSVPDCHQILRMSCQESVRKGLNYILCNKTSLALYKIILTRRSPLFTKRRVAYIMGLQQPSRLSLSNI